MRGTESEVPGMAGEVLAQVESEPAGLIQTLDAGLTKREQAEALDAEALELCGQIVRAARGWARLGHIAFQMEQTRGWEELGFRSQADWMMGLQQRSGYGRSSVYRFKKLVERLLPDISVCDLEKMEPGNAGFLSGEVCSSSVRRDPEVIQAAQASRETSKLREFVMGKHPSQHIEEKHEEHCYFPLSAWEVIESEMEFTRIEEGAEMTFVEIVEKWASEREEARRMVKGRA
jgi:hypothetical protein